jgi:hypothetical protein
MKKTFAILFTLVTILITVFPAYAIDPGTLNWESKAAYARWEFTDSDVTYHIAVSYVISHLHTETEPSNKNAIVYVVITKDGNSGAELITFVKSDLNKDEYTLPNFSEGNNPTLTTTVQVEDSISDDSYFLSIDLMWECIGKKTKTSFHPPQDDPYTRVLSYEITTCPAQGSGSILQNGINLIDPSNRSQAGFITHHRRVMIDFEPE